MVQSIWGLKGVILSFDPSSPLHSLIILDNFTNGGNLYGSLMVLMCPVLQALTSSGGSSDGVIFSFDPSSATCYQSWRFDYTNGAKSLWQPYPGKWWLFGMTSFVEGSNGYVVFSFDPSSLLYILKEFDNK